MGKNPNVLLVCSNDGLVNLLRIPRILKQSGCNITLLTTKGNPLTHSRFIDLVLPKEQDVQALIISLKNHLNTNCYAWILVGDESPLFEIIKYRGETWIESCLPVDAKSGAVDIIASKDGFVKACIERGLSFPGTRVCSSIEHALTISENIGYPVMLKTIRGSSGIGVRLAQNPEELLAAHKSVNSPVKFILQKYVTGRVGVTEILMDHGEPLAWISSYKYQTVNGSLGPSCARQFMVHPSMETIVRQIGEMTKFHGLCGFDWIHNDASDSIFVIEFHARPPSGFHLGEVCHVNFAAGIRNMLSGQKNIQRPTLPPSGKPKRAYMFPQHVSRCIKERDFVDLIHWFPGISANCHYDILLNDINLLMSMMGHSLINKLTKIYTHITKRELCL